MNSEYQCPFCDSWNTRPGEFQVDLSTKFGKGSYMASSSTCLECGESFVSPNQARENDERALILRNKLKLGERTLGGLAIREIREYLNLSQKDAAGIFGGGEIAFSRYESDSVAMSKAAENLLKVLYIQPNLLNQIKQVQNLSLAEIKIFKESEEKAISANKIIADFRNARSTKKHVRLIQGNKSIPYEFEKIDTHFRTTTHIQIRPGALPIKEYQINSSSQSRLIYGHP
ncbi:TPA: type II toxin-antitoxin system MqsA family antitoxin [Burkholderia vietnamiensis]|nr:type II toxin-antitoxin system MqsA family antitoxin [Burkholderia vietnamiensis]